MKRYGTERLGYIVVSGDLESAYGLFPTHEDAARYREAQPSVAWRRTAFIVAVWSPE